MVSSGFFNDASCNIDEFREVTSRQTEIGSLRYASDVQANIPIYLVSDLLPLLAGEERQTIQAEWAQVLETGAGVLVLSGMITQTDVIDQATSIFHQIIADEAEATKGEGDHFAAAGNNARIWNSAQKLCLKTPEVFARYFGNIALEAVCEAWLGPAYQVTAQVNLVNPGGKAQDAHRDYHLGFQSTERMRAYPSHVHALSPALTLQGAVAHCDMPLESGPTKLLPFSQSYGAGYVAMKRPEFQQLFEQKFVQLPLTKGDGLFFNPALFHAAGQNISKDIERMANLLQVSSAFGRAMESQDRKTMSLSLYPALQELRGELGPARIDAAIAACAEGYPFPTNLDSDPPLDGMAPESQAKLMRRALRDRFSLVQFEQALLQQSGRRQA
jgi:ectoine hydroxylase-related dioxygenase (phytanoyl-CoA dioxygenase family)